MKSEIRPALVVMCRKVLNSLVRVLIRFDVSAGELKAIVDSVYANVGSEYLRGQRERVTFSKLAVITGINRSFLPRLLATPQDDFQPRSNTQLHRAARVLNGWHDDANFQTSRGLPALLRIRGPRSFERLVERYSGGVYYRTLLSELVRVGAVKRIGKHRVRALRRTPTVGGANAASLHAIGETVGDLLNTLEHNLTAPTGEHLPVRCLALNVSPRTLPLFRVQLAKRADGLLESMDAFLQAHRSDLEPGVGKNVDSVALTLGVGVFAICRSAPDEKHASPATSRK